MAGRDGMINDTIDVLNNELKNISIYDDKLLAITLKKQDAWSNILQIITSLKGQSDEHLQQVLDRVERMIPWNL